MAVIAANPPADKVDPVRRRLGLGEPPKQGEPIKLRLIARDKAGATVALSGAASVSQIRNVALAHDLAIKRHRSATRPKNEHADKKVVRLPSPIVLHKRIDGEQKPAKMPTVGLHPVYGRYIRFFARLIAYFLDGLILPFGLMKGKKIVWGTLLGTGILLLFVFLPVALVMDTYLLGLLRRPDLQIVMPIYRIVRWVIFWLLATPGVLGIVAGVQFRLGRTYRALFRPLYEPAPAWRDEPVFWLGSIRRLLSDFWEGTIAFGGVGSGKTVGFISPLLMQAFRKLNNPDPNAIDARFFALALDVKGTFGDLLSYMCIQVGRPLTDIIFVDPDLDLYRYNPLDPYDPEFAERGAETLAAVNKIMGNESKGENIFWDKSSQNVIRFMLKNLSIIRPKDRIGLDDVGRFVRDDDRVAALMKKATAVLETKRRNNMIAADEYDEMVTAISELRSNWASMDGRTKSILRVTIQNMLGPIPSTPRLQRIFCRDTNFSMRDVINDGKIVIFRSRTLDPQTARMLAVCLKRDFQTWTRRRIERDRGLNQTRTGMFVADEYQEVVTCGGQGDESYFSLCRESRIMCVVATQVRSALEVAINNEQQLKQLLGSLTTKVFLKLSDKETQEMGAFHAGKHHREKERATIHKGVMLGTFASPLGQKGGVDFSTMVDETLEDYYRADDFAKLKTVSKKSSLNGPWYSESIIYNYSETDSEKETWCVKTRLPHLYPNKKQVELAARYFDDLLYSYNALARMHRMFYAVAAAGMAARQKAETECRSQAEMLAEKLRLRAQQGHSAMPVSSAGLLHKIEEDAARAKREMDQANEALDKYQQSEGTFGKNYATLRAAALRKTAEYHAVLPISIVAKQAGVQVVMLGDRETSALLLDRRTVEDAISRARASGHPKQIEEGSPEALSKRGPAADAVPKPGISNATDLQNSAIPPQSVRPSGPIPPSSPATAPAAAAPEPTPSQPGQPSCDEMTKFINEVMQDAPVPLAVERQRQELDKRWQVADSEYDRTFPATPQPPGPSPLEPPSTNVQGGSPAANDAALDRLLRTTESDYS